MWQTILLSLVAGAMAANATPHFVKGITNEAYPNVVGGSPVSNLVAGWAGFVLTALLVSWAHAQRHPIWAFASGALGVLLMGLFHASGRTIGTTSHRGTHPIPPTETRHEGSHTATSEQQTTRQPPSDRTETACGRRRPCRCHLAGAARGRGSHLPATIRTGRYCAYLPDPRAPIAWER